MVNKKVWLVIKIFIATALLGLVFVNCSDVKVSTLTSIEVSSAKPEISICSFANTENLQDKLKIAFIIDMSGSNVRPVNSTPATDSNYTRLLAIRDFISSHPDFEYKVIPFSDNILPGTNCGELYKDSASSLTVINNLISVQQSEALLTIPNLMGQTFYGFAFTCAQQSLMYENSYYNSDPNDSVKLKEFQQTHYKTFFATDGQPSDPDQMSNILSTIHDMSLVTSQAAEFQLIPVFYGGNPPPTAIPLLRQIGLEGNWVNPPNNDPLLVQNVSQIDFNKLLSYTLNEQHKILEFNIVNLNSISRNGHLIADSDADGVPDIDDLDSQNRRSNSEYLLDGICKKFGPTFCKKPTICDPTKYNALRFNECDMVAMNATDALDSDNDNIPDLVEYLHRSNPLVNDAFNDSDNDQIQNIVEIRAGNQIDDSVKLSSAETFVWNRVKSNEKLQSCPALQDLWRIKVDQIPTVKVKSFQDPSEILSTSNSAISLSHETNENVILVYYVQQLVNGDPKKPVRELYGKILKIKHGTVTSPQLSPEDFVKLGELNGTAQLFQGTP